jgi:hypothetical protein
MSQKDMDDVKKAIAAIDAKKKNIRAKIYSGGSTGLVQQKGRIRTSSKKTKVGILKEIKDTLKRDYQIDIVLIQVGYYFEAIEEDAQYFKNEFKFKIHNRGGNSSYEVTGFTDSSLDEYKNKLLKRSISFCVVEQIPPKKEDFKRANNSIERKVTFASHDQKILNHPSFFN